MNAIVFNTIGRIKRAAVIFDDTVYRLEVSEGKEGRIGDIYMGRVAKVLDSLQAVFVDIGIDKNGYLQKEDLKGGYEKDRISELLKMGDEIAVQIKKEAVGDKGPKLTGKLSVQGDGLVFYDDDKNRIALSNKVNNPKSIRRLKELAYSMHDKPCGMIIRTHAETLSYEAIKKDYENLEAKWEDICAQKVYAMAPKRIYKGRDFVVETVINNSYKGIEKIVFDCDEDMKSVLNACAGIESKTCEFRDISEGFNTFSLFSLEKTLEEAVKKKIWLKSGGNIVIEETEALTSIDVNSAKSAAKAPRTVAAATNMEAAIEASRQIILRNLSGMILVDFIDADRRAQEELCKAMEDVFIRYDNRKFDIYGFTKAGLFEMAREKKGVSIGRFHMREEIFEKPVYTLGKIERELARIKSETSMVKLELGIDSSTGIWLEKRGYQELVKERYGLSLEIKKGKDIKPGDFEISYL
ncbi:MAG: ribonuclease E/G [Peptostreptococcaceae bacterium]|nr:ribonuclease E/G [Peptostreptococcaceae bacterium]